jgi:hypothetical protein
VARGGHGGPVAVRFQPTLDGGLGVDAIESDADRLEVPALGGPADRRRDSRRQPRRRYWIHLTFDPSGW